MLNPMDEITRPNRALGDWLTDEDRDVVPPNAGFSVRDLRETNEPDPAIQAFLRSEMAAGQFNADFVRDTAIEMGWDEVAQLFDAAQPTARRARRGYFGEILAAAIVRRCERSTTERRHHA